jgi:serine/threonine protein phosphatase 1
MAQAHKALSKSALSRPVRDGRNEDGDVLKSIFRKAKRRLPSAPEGLQIYAVGDIHGRLDLLNELFTVIDANSARSPSPGTVEIYLGDYIDRGPASREVLDALIGRSRSRSRRHRVVFVRGNHETYPLHFLRDPAFLAAWGQLGGLETLMSYGLHPAVSAAAREQIETAQAFQRALPPAHRDFLQNLVPYASYGDFYFVHAGVRPGVPLANQREEDLLEIRDPFLNSHNDFGKIVVHGHTPVHTPEFRPNRINIDTGAYATGKLTCLAIAGSKLRVL